jgi:hypothetical protein
MAEVLLDQRRPTKVTHFWVHKARLNLDYRMFPGDLASFSRQNRYHIIGFGHAAHYCPSAQKQTIGFVGADFKNVLSRARYRARRGENTHR